MSKDRIIELRRSLSTRLRERIGPAPCSFSSLAQLGKKSKRKKYNKQNAETREYISPEKLKPILNGGYPVYTCSFYLPRIEKLLQSQHTANVINQIDVEKLEVIFNKRDSPFYPHTLTLMKWLRDNEHTVSALNLFNIEKFSVLMTYDYYFKDYILKELLKDKNIAIAINSLSLKKLIMINNNGQFNGRVFGKIFGNPDNIIAIHSMDIRKLNLLLKSGSFCMEMFGKKNNYDGNVKVIEYLINKDNCYDDRDSEKIIKAIKNWKNITINFEELKLLIESRIFNYEFILELIKLRKLLKIRNSLDITKFKTLIKYGELFMPYLASRPSSPNEYAISIRFMHCCLLTGVLLNNELIAFINRMDTETLEFLLNLSMSEKYTHDMSVVCRLLRDPYQRRLITSVDTEKLKVLSEHYDIFDLLSQANNSSHTFHFLNSIDVGKLKKISKILPYKEFIRLTQLFCKTDINHNAHLFIALHEAGVIKVKDCNILLDKKAIEDKVKKAFPGRFPIDQILVPSSIEQQGAVLNLKTLCIGASIGLVNRYVDMKSLNFF